MKIYLRMKAVKDAGDSWRPDANGTWQYVPVPDSVGKPPQWVLDAEKKGAALFYLRPGGERYSSREAAKRAAKKAVATSAAVRHGLSLTDADPNRQSIRSAVEHFLERKSRKAPRTVRNFEHILTEFIDWLPYEVRFVDQVTSPVLLKYQSYVESLPGKSGSKASPKTVHNKLLVICFMLKSAGVARPSHMVEFPTIEEEIPEPYSTEELGKLFSAMDSFNGKGKQHEDADAFKFFLASACREQEVAHATWRDIDWAKGTYTVAAKTWNLDGIEKRFTPKNHERRTIPLTIEVMKMLRSRAKSMTGTSEPKSAAWIFPNSDGQPEGHFLRQWKKIAREADLNCGDCQSRRGEEIIEHACARPNGECHAHYLHRLRKSRATFWQENNVSLRTIQYRLGHKSLETTQKYLGVQDAIRTHEADNKPMYRVPA